MTKTSTDVRYVMKQNQNKEKMQFLLQLEQNSVPYNKDGTCKYPNHDSPKKKRF